MKELLLEVSKLKVSFYNNDKFVQVVRDFDLHVHRGEIVGLLGESGSGKTVSASSIMKLIAGTDGKIDSGSIIYDDIDLMKLSERKMRSIRGNRISFVFQNPSTSLHPYKKVGKQLIRTLKTHRKPWYTDLIIDAFAEVGIMNPETVFNMYPYQLSGGENQRVMIARSILCHPELLIADEPTSSIDASLRKRVLDLFKGINDKYNMALLIITHDFDVAKYMCDRIVIMYGGLVVEEGSTADITENPLHPYTEELIKCAQSLDNEEEIIYSLEGMPPTPLEFGDKCPFYNRCDRATDKCLEKIPELEQLENRKVRCCNR